MSRLWRRPPARVGRHWLHGGPHYPVEELHALVNTTLMLQQSRVLTHSSLVVNFFKASSV